MSRTVVQRWATDTGMTDVDAPDWIVELDNASDDEWHNVQRRIMGDEAVWGDLDNYGVEVFTKPSFGRWVIFWHPSGILVSSVWVPQDRDFLDFALKYIAPWIGVGAPSALNDTLDVIKNAILEHVEHHGPELNQWTGASVARERRERDRNRAAMEDRKK